MWMYDENDNFILTLGRNTSLYKINEDTVELLSYVFAVYCWQ